MYNLVQGDTALNHHFFVRGVSDPFFSSDLSHAAFFGANLAQISNTLKLQRGVLLFIRTL